MKAIITGASSGLGRDMARILSKRGYDIIAVARRKEKLLELQKELKTQVEILCLDLSRETECMALAQRADEADIFINNAGFGVFGDFEESSGSRAALGTPHRFTLFDWRRFGIYAGDFHHGWNP